MILYCTRPGMAALSLPSAATMAASVPAALTSSVVSSSRSPSASLYLHGSRSQLKVVCQGTSSERSSLGRREVVSLTSAAAASLVFGSFSRANALEDASKAAENPFIKDLLEKSKANKEKYDKERLEDYYKRNFKEYMDFIGGPLERKKDLSENDKAILEWIKKNS